MNQTTLTMIKALKSLGATSMSFHPDGNIERIEVMNTPMLPDIKPSDLEKIDEDILFWSVQ
jgi:hypothetical protein